MDGSSIRSYLNITGEAVLPVSIQKEETVYPHLLHPEFFLWRSLSNEQGLPLQTPHLYSTDFTQLSAEQLYEHVGHVLEDYLFLADVSQHPREYWLDKISRAFHNHPFVRFFHKNKTIIKSVETMNQSALLSVLKYPEDIAYWRHRVAIVMRPFRSLPDTWLKEEQGSCTHEKGLSFHSKTREISCHCERCDFNLSYHIDEDRVSFQEEYNVERAKKRIVTIEEQFNEIAEQNKRLLIQLDQLKILKKQLAKACKTLDESLEIVHLIERYQQSRVDLQSFPVLDMYHKLQHVVIPAQTGPSLLIWLASVKLEDVHVLKELSNWLEIIPEHVYPLTNHILDELKERLEAVRYEEEDVIMTIKGHKLTYRSAQQILDLIHYYGTDYPAHTLVQVLAGKTTNKLRSLYLHETRWFGLLSDWPEKHIQKLFNQLEKQGWLMKQQKGYSVSDFAEEVM